VVAVDAGAGVSATDVIGGAVVPADVAGSDVYRRGGCRRRVAAGDRWRCGVASPVVV
jgi:hypothetical protein